MLHIFRTPFYKNTSGGLLLDYHQGETSKRVLLERVLDHAGRNPNSHLLKHSEESEHPVSDRNDYKIMDKGHKNTARKQKISEVLLIKEMKPTLYKNDNLVELKLSN